MIRNSLETFLGGMETTDTGPQIAGRKQALKPSLVEWKRSIRIVVRASGSALKPSLVEWKLVPVKDFPVVRKDLETFLGGMETLRRDR